MSVGAQPYSARPALTRLPGERIPAWACACPVPHYKKHQEPQECLTARDIAAWRARHPEATCSERPARALAWMEGEFGKMNLLATMLIGLIVMSGVPWGLICGSLHWPIWAVFIVPSFLFLLTALVLVLGIDV